eukprot:12609445-Prorocentrum_lima.AAC.1
MNPGCLRCKGGLRHQALAGRIQNGTGEMWAPAPAKEYPERLSRFIAAAIVQQAASFVTHGLDPWESDGEPWST